MRRKVSSKLDILLSDAYPSEWPVQGTHPLTHPDQSQPNDGIRLEFSFRRLPSLLRLGVILRRAYKRQDLDQETPTLVALTPASSETLARAHILAESGREDREAISELRALSSGNARTLREAALGARQRGQHRESSWADLTHRLLQAAIHNTSIVRLNNDDRSRLQSFDDFASMPVGSKWASLTDLEPRLLGLVDDACDGQFGRTTQPDELRDLSPDQKRQATTAQIIGRRRLNDRLVSLVGPQSRTDNPLIRSRLAINAACRYLSDSIQHPKSTKPGADQRVRQTGHSKIQIKVG